MVILILRYFIPTPNYKLKKQGTHMALLALLIALVIEHYYHRESSNSRYKVNHRSWFSRYQDKMTGWFGEQSWYKGWVGDALLLIGPALLVYWIFAWYHHDFWFHGGFMSSLVMLVLAVAVLMLCLGPESPRKSLDAYYKARAAHEDESAYEIAMSLLGEKEFQKSEAGAGEVSDANDTEAAIEQAETETSNPETLEELDKLVARWVFKKTQSRYFAVVLWFMLLGPAGALLYRLTNWYLETNSSKGFAYKLDLILEWIPARISALAYLLAGDMGTGVSKIKSNFLDFDKDGLDFVQDAGEASLGFYEADDVRGPSRWALKLSERAAVIVFALVAIMSLLGIGMY